MASIIQVFRKPLAKIITRAVLYGLTSWLGVSAAQADEPATKVAEGVAALLLLIATGLLDRWHHKKDTDLDENSMP